MEKVVIRLCRNVQFLYLAGLPIIPSYSLVSETRILVITCVVAVTAQQSTGAETN